MVIQSGSVKVFLDGQFAFKLGAQQAGMIPGGHTLRLEFDEAQESWQYFLHRLFSPEELKGLAKAPAVARLSPEMSQLLESLAGLCDRGLAQDHPLLLSLARSAFLLFQEDCVRERATRPALHPALFRARRHLWDHLAEPVALRDLAKAANVTPEHLVRLFKRHLGVTPIEYLWRERVRIAVQVLRKTGLSLAEVAERTGFKQVFHFSRRIKKSTGMSPMALRRLAREGQGFDSIPGQAPDPLEQSRHPRV